MIIASKNFLHTGIIPKIHTCDGGDIAPSIIFDQVPERARSFVLIVDDPDSSHVSGGFVHWLVWNIPSSVREISSINSTTGFVQGKNSFGTIGYKGPCPQVGTHRYFFKVYALDVSHIEVKNLTKEELLKSIEGHVIDYGILIGLYHR